MDSDNKSTTIPAGVVRKQLKIKIKFPMSCGEDDQKENHQPLPADQAKEAEYACSLCGKGFRTRKALGGHMRIHSHLNTSSTTIHHLNKTPIPAGEGMDEKSVCPICERDFPSNKALFGHMRCHPERSWRGIQPPQQLNHNNNSSSSTVSSSGDHFVDNVVNDLLGFGWGAKGIRGRNGTNNDDKSMQLESIAPEQLIGVQSLLLLSQGGVEYSDKHNKTFNGIKHEELDYILCKEKKKLSAESESTHRDGHHDSGIIKGGEINGKKRKKNSHVLTAKQEEVMTGLMTNSNKFKLSDICDQKGSAHIIYNADAKKQVHKVGKHCMFHDYKADLVGHNNVLPHIFPMAKKLTHHHLQDVKWDIVADNNKERYQCTFCNKCFSSHQALGGHMSSHNKSRSTAPARPIINDRSQNLAIPQGQDQGIGFLDDHLGLLTMAASTNVHPLHQCNVCFKIYPSGQALGGHKRLHCSLSPVISNTPRVLLPPVPQPSSIIISEQVSTAAAPSLTVQASEIAPLPPPPAAPIDHKSVFTTDNNGGFIFDLNELPPNEDELQPADQNP